MRKVSCQSSRDAQPSFLSGVRTFLDLYLRDRASVKFYRFCQFRRVESGSIRQVFRGRISPFFAIVRRIRIHREKSELESASLSLSRFLVCDAQRSYVHITIVGTTLDRKNYIAISPSIQYKIFQSGTLKYRFTININIVISIKPL